MDSICSTDTKTKTKAVTVNPVVRSWESYTREQAEGCPRITEPNFTSIDSLEKMPEKPDDVIRDLEERQIPVIKESLQSTNPAGKLMDFMTSGADEFKKRTGRDMTYAEMRSAWG